MFTIATGRVLTEQEVTVVEQLRKIIKITQDGQLKSCTLVVLHADNPAKPDAVGKITLSIMSDINPDMVVGALALHQTELQSVILAERSTKPKDDCEKTKPID